MFEDPNAQVLPFPQPKSIQINSQKDVSANNREEKQFNEENSSDLPKEAELKFPNDLVAKSTKKPECSDTVVDCPERANLCDSSRYGEIM